MPILAASFIGYALILQAANTRAGIVVVAPGAFFESAFQVHGRDLVGVPIEVTYEFTVESGPPVDIYLLDDAGYSRYLAGATLDPSAEIVHENVTSVSGSPYPHEGLWHAVIDNTGYGAAKPTGASAAVRYAVHLGMSVDTLPLSLALVAGLAFLVVGPILIMRGYAAPPPATPPAFCAFCGQPSGTWLCPNCGRASPPDPAAARGGRTSR